MFQRAPFAFLIALASLSIAPGCSSGSSGTDALGGGAPADAQRALATVSFPPPGSATSARTLVVRGTASDTTGVAAVRVNGVDAQTTDDFATWRATVALAGGANALIVETIDSVGNVDANAAASSVTRTEVLFAGPGAIAVDGGLDRALVLDPLTDSLFGVELKSGRRSVVSGPDVGSGPLFRRPRTLSVDAAAGLAYIADVFSHALFVVNLQTGDRIAVPFIEEVALLPILDLYGTALDPAAGTMLATDGWLSVSSVDLATGTVSILSSALTSVGAGVEMNGPKGLFLDAANNRAIVGDSSSKSVLAVDLVSGDRSLLFDATASPGEVAAPWTLAHDVEHGRALAVDMEGTEIAAIDLQTGARTILSDGTLGSGAPFERIGGICVDAPRARALVVDEARDGVVAVDLSSGDRSPVSSAGHAAGIALLDPVALVHDAVRERLVVADADRRALIAVDGATGDRTLLADVAAGAPALSRPRDLALDAARDRVLMTSSFDERILAIDLETGASSLFASDTQTAGPFLGIPGAVAIDPVNDRGVVFGNVGGLMALDLETGERTTLSSALVGSGPIWTSVFAIAVDPAGRTAYLADITQDALLSVDLATGARSILATDVFEALPFGGGTAFDLGPEAMLGSGLVFDAQRGELIVAYGSGFRAGGVASVHPATGAVQVLSNSASGDGPRIVTASSIALAPDSELAWIVDPHRQMVLAVDTLTGERVVTSK